MARCDEYLDYWASGPLGSCKSLQMNQSEDFK